MTAKQSRRVFSVCGAIALSGVVTACLSTTPKVEYLPPPGTVWQSHVEPVQSGKELDVQTEADKP